MRRRFAASFSGVFRSQRFEQVEAFGGGSDLMGALLVVLLVALVLAGAGFALHLLWWAALIVAVFWLAGFAFRGGDSAHWYRW